MFSVEGIEVLGTPIDTDTYIRMVKFCMNTRTQYMSANIMLNPQRTSLIGKSPVCRYGIANVILQKGTRASFRQWDKNDYDLDVTTFQKSTT